MSNFHIVVKSNFLIEARYKLSLNEQRLILLLISVIQPDDDDFRDYELRATEFAEMFGIECDKDINARVEEAASSLVGRKLDLSMGDERCYVAWLSNASYKKGKGVISIRFDKSLKPYLLHLKSQFTQYRLNCVIKFRGSYSIRLYELLKSYEYLGGGKCFYREVGLTELRRFFDIDNDCYKQICNLKSRVIEPSVDEINNHSDILISAVDYIKEGRVIKTVRFTVQPKYKNDAFNEDDFSDTFKILTEYGIAAKTANQWIKEYGTENILKACRFVRAKQAAGEVKDVPAYLAKALKDGYYVAWIEGESKKQAKRSTEMARKAQKEEDERKAKEAVRLRIDAALEAFHARPEIEQIGLRTMFGNTANPITAKAWKKSMVAEPQPENNARFRFEFVTFLESYQ